MRRTTLAALVAALTTAALAGCGAAEPPAPIVVTETVTVAPPAPPISAEGTTTTAPPVAASWLMPDLVGSGLQDAQDALQQLTSYGIAVTTSHDATGADRMQVSDRNWKVCTQNVPPGTTISPGTRIDFGAVKLEEDC